jgi:hypothetical protein
MGKATLLQPSPYSHAMAGRLGGDVIHYAVDAAHLIDEAPHLGTEKIIGEIADRR